MSEQLILPMGNQRLQTFTNYYAHTNSNAAKALEMAVSAHEHSYTVIYGQAGIGKTHLLQAAIYKAHELAKPYKYLQGHPKLNRDLLISAYDYQVVCVDDVDQLLGHGDYEEILFHLYNHVAQNGACLILSTSRPVQSLQIRLADLRSRIYGSMVFSLQHLGEEDTKSVVEDMAAAKSLVTSEEVINFLLRRCSRNLSDLAAIINLLDTRAVSEMRKLTIPFIKTVLSL